MLGVLNVASVPDIAIWMTSPADVVTAEENVNVPVVELAAKLTEPMDEPFFVMGMETAPVGAIRHTGVGDVDKPDGNVTGRAITRRAITCPLAGTPEKNTGMSYGCGGMTLELNCPDALSAAYPFAAFAVEL